MTALENIQKLSQSLPKGDVILANIFIDSREFESLQELVNSAIIKAKKNLRSDNPKEEYINLDMDDLITLKAEVDFYVEQLTLPSQEDFDPEEEEYYEEEY